MVVSFLELVELTIGHNLHVMDPHVVRLEIYDLSLKRLDVQVLGLLPVK